MDAVIMIGNSNGALNGREWSSLVAEVRDLLAENYPAVVVHSEWLSPSDSALQNVAWRVELAGMGVLREDLASLAVRYRQPSVAWLQGIIESAAV